MLSHLKNTGRTHFKKGCTPWNKGKKGVQTSWLKGKHNLFANTSGLITKESIEKSRQSRLGLPSSFKGKRHTEETKQINRQKHIGRVAWNKGLVGFNKGHKSYVTDPEKRKEYARMGSLALFNKKGRTNIETKVNDFLRSLKVPYKEQELINNRFLVDFFIPSSNLVIECDGEYWHSMEKVRKKDKAENAYLLTCGFNLIRLKESAIMDNSYEKEIIKWLY